MKCCNIYCDNRNDLFEQCEKYAYPCNPYNDPEISKCLTGIINNNIKYCQDCKRRIQYERDHCPTEEEMTEAMERDVEDSGNAWGYVEGNNA